MDFTPSTYKRLLISLREADYAFMTFGAYMKQQKKRCIVLRHDVELRTERALELAEICASLGVQATFFFRFVDGHIDASVVKRVAELGHEVGYHYDDLSMSYGILHEALIRFEQHLSTLRELVPIETMVAEGDPTSAIDNRDLWERHDYKDYGIIGEPYFDMDFSKALYLTDTGRRWDGYKVSVRDKIPAQQERWEQEGLIFRTTDDIMCAAQSDKLPEQIMLTFHPQRWHEFGFEWFQEIVLQNVKNLVKKVLIKIRK